MSATLLRRTAAAALTALGLGLAAAPGASAAVPATGAILEGAGSPGSRSARRAPRPTPRSAPR
jgi:hypothetical protein